MEQGSWLITYKDALEKHGCLDLEDLQYEAEFLTWDQASQNSFTFACHLTSTIGIRINLDPFNPDWIASAENADLAQAMINSQHLTPVAGLIFETKIERFFWRDFSGEKLLPKNSFLGQ